MFPERSKGAFHLGAVCRTWRNIAWTTPSLWTSLVFWVVYDTTEPQVQLAIEWLNRSGNLPLSIVLRNCSSEKELLVLPLIDVSNRSLSRCLHFYLDNFTSLTLSRLHQFTVPCVLQYLRLNRAKFTTPFNFGPVASHEASDRPCVIKAYCP